MLRSPIRPWRRPAGRCGQPQPPSPPHPTDPRAASAPSAAPATSRPEPSPAPTSGLAGLVFSGLAGSWRLGRRIDSALASEPSGAVYGTAVFQPLPLLRPAIPPRLLEDVATTAAADAAAPAAADYHYHEQGEFQTDAGGRFRVRREYVYGYSPVDDRIDVFFAAAGGARDYLFHSLRFTGDGGGDGGDVGVADAAGKERETDGGSGGAAGGNGRAGEVGRPPADAGCSSNPSQSQTGDDAEMVSSSSSSVVAVVAAAVHRRRREGRWWCGAVGDHRCDQDMHYVSYRFGFRGATLEQFKVSYEVRGPQIDYVTTAVYSREPGAAATAT